VLFDIGANLTQESFHHDLDQVLSDSKSAGVAKIMVTGASVDGSEQALEIAEGRDNLYATAGIHPHHAELATPAGMAKIAALTKDPNVKAVGETGLDFFRDFSPRDQQIDAFERHIELAIDTGLPMFLHERDAYPEFYEQIARHRSELSDLVVHCFTGAEEALDAYIDLGCHIGITGWICDERRGQHLLPLVKKIPKDKLLIETDAPYLLPRTIKPKPKSRRNEPKHLAHICEFIADVLNEDPAHLAQQTHDNAARFFRLES
jgi:TatD DNase family protein